MANIGSSTLLIKPKFDNLSGSIDKALGSVDASGQGEKVGKSYSSGVEKGASGLATSGALIGVFSTLTSKAMDLISSSIGGAVSRLDTLSNYPRVMETLGYSADDAQSSIDTMSKHLDGLPTSLDAMSSTVQGLSAITGDLSQATDVGLALNDMLLAGGSSTQVVNAAMEQFRQALSKGKPDMMDWRSMVSAAPGQMKQLSETMLGAGSSTNDLYQALQDGTVSMQDMCDAMVTLDTTGSDSVTSFADQAKTATGGIQSSMDNAKTAITRGLTDILDSIGRDNITGAIKGIGSIFEDALSKVGDALGGLQPLFSAFGSLVSNHASQLGTASLAVAGYAGAVKVLGGLGGKLGGLADSLGNVATKGSMLGKLSGGIGKLGTALSGPLGIGLSVAAVGVGLLVSKISDAKQKEENFTKSTDGLREATTTLAPSVDKATASFDDLGTSAQDSSTIMEDAAQSQATLADTISERNSTAQDSIDRLQGARQVIDDYMNVSGLSAEQQGKLKDAITLVNSECGTQYTVVDAANGVIYDENDALLTTCDTIDTYIAKKQAQIRADALSANLTDLYAQQTDDIKAVAAAQQTYDDKLAWAEQHKGQQGYWTLVEDANNAKKDLDDANASLDQVNSSIDATNQQLGNLTETTDGASTSVGTYAGSLNEITATFDQLGKGAQLPAFEGQIDSLGISMEDFKTLSSKQLGELAYAYDGTTDSITAKMDEWGISYDHAAANISGITQSIMGYNGDVVDSFTGLLSGAGLSMDDFTSMLAGVGVSADDMSGISSDAFASMLDSCGGDLNLLMAEIALYNDAPIVDKDGNVTLDSTQLVDAQNNVYTWNGSQIVDQSGNAVVDDLSLTDAQGNLVTWDGSSLVSQSASATVGGNLDAMNEAKSLWNSEGLSSYGAVARITAIMEQVSQNAAGGIRPHADGGIRYHAGGSIVDVPGTGYPLDMVGEAGAEAIVPLENTRYSQPFADIIADSVVRKTEETTGNADVVAKLDQMMDVMRTVGIYLDGKSLVGGITADMDAALGRRQAAYSRGL